MDEGGYWPIYGCIFFAKNRVANHLTQGDLLYFAFNSQGRKPYFALICRFKWLLNIYCPLRPYSIFMLKYEAKTLQIQQSGASSTCIG